jgi:hypothetical protein
VSNKVPPGCSAKIYETRAVIIYSTRGRENVLCFHTIGLCRVPLEPEAAGTIPPCKRSLAGPIPGRVTQGPLAKE